MADKEYLLKWAIDPSKAVSGAQAIRAELLDLEQVVDRLGPKLKGLGRGVSGLTRMAGGADKLTAALKATDREASTLAPKLKDVGKGNSGLGRMASRAEKLRGSLQTVQVQAIETTVALEGTGAASIAAGRGLSAAAGHSEKLTGNFGRLLTAGLALVAIKKVVGEMGDAIKEARERSETTAEESLDRRGKARELANLMGESEPNDKVMGRIFSVGLATGMKFDESLAFLEQFEGSIPAGEQMGHIRKTDKRALAEEAGRFTRRIGLDTATGGDLAGVIPQFTDLTKDAQGKETTQQQAVEKAAGQLGAVAYGLNEGRGKVSRLAKAEIAAAIPMIASGRVEDLAEGAAFAGVGSLFAGRESQAGTRLKQLDRMLNKAGDKSGSEFLRETGIDQEKGNFARLTKLKEHIDKVKPDDVQKYLVEQGFGNSEEVAAAQGFLANYDVLRQRITKARSIAADGKPTIAQDKQYMQGLDAQNQLSQVRNEAADQIEGEKNERLMIARRNAMAELKSEGSFSPALQLFADKVKGGFGLNDFLGFPDQLKQRLDDRVSQNVAREAANAGVDPAALGLAYDQEVQDEDGTKRTEQRVRVHGDALNELAAKGVNVTGSSGDVGGIGAKMRARDRGPVSPPPKGKPGAGVVPADPGAGGQEQADPFAGGLLGPVPANVIPAGRKPDGGAAGANGAPGANGQGLPGPQASVDASSLDRAADKLGQAAQAMLQASRSGGGGMGGAFDHYEPETPGYGPTRS